MDAEPMTTDPIVELLDTARALRVLASGGDNDEGATNPGVAKLLRLLADNVDECAQRLDDAGIH